MRQKASGSRRRQKASGSGHLSQRSLLWFSVGRTRPFPRRGEQAPFPGGANKPLPWVSHRECGSYVTVSYESVARGLELESEADISMASIQLGGGAAAGGQRPAPRPCFSLAGHRTCTLTLTFCFARARKRGGSKNSSNNGNNNGGSNNSKNKGERESESKREKERSNGWREVAAWVEGGGCSVMLTIVIIIIVLVVLVVHVVLRVLAQIKDFGWRPRPSPVPLQP